MPNTTPVPELIAIEIESRLNTILKENGYPFDVSEVVRPTRRGENWTYRHFGIGLIQGPSERVEDLDCPGNPPAIAYTTTYTLECICKDSKNAEEAHATNENEMAAAAILAITNDDGNMWYTMNDNAVYVVLGTPEPFQSSEGENNGVSVPILVTYRVSENNPLEVRA